MSADARAVIVVLVLALAAGGLRLAFGAAPVAGTGAIYAALRLGPQPAGWPVRVELAVR